MNPILNVVGPSGYKYTNDLMRLGTHPNPCIADPSVGTVRMSLLVAAWGRCLRSYPDKDLVQYILKGLVHGFHTGVQALPVFANGWVSSGKTRHNYVDGILPFGLSSALKIFTAVADALEWCVYKAGVKYIYHYLDDFAVLGSPGSEECHRHHLLCLQSVAADFGVHLAPNYCK